MKTQQVKPFFSAAKKDSILELLVYETIGEDWWDGGGVTAKSVAQQINNAGDFSSISVRINSPGGDAFEGAAIYNLLRSQGKPIHVYIDGVAASAASAIAMAGDTRAIGSNAMIMIHNAWSFCAGDARDMRRMADTLDKVTTSLAQVYVERTGKPMEEIQAMLDAETWMGAQECIDNGFATELMNQDDKESQNAAALAAQFKMEKHYKHVPESLKAVNSDEIECSCPCIPCMDGNCADCDCDGCKSMECASEVCNCGEEVVDNASNLNLYEARLALLGRSA